VGLYVGFDLTAEGAVDNPYQDETCVYTFNVQVKRLVMSAMNGLDTAQLS
jgi:hypothetical protein